MENLASLFESKTFTSEVCFVKDFSDREISLSARNLNILWQKDFSVSITVPAEQNGKMIKINGVTKLINVTYNLILLFVTDISNTPIFANFSDSDFAIYQSSRIFNPYGYISYLN